MNIILIIITGVLGATMTYLVSHELKQGAVRASALLALLVGLFFYCFPELCNAYLTKNIPIVFIGTSFIGMVSSSGRQRYVQLTFAGILFSVIYSYNYQLFEGYGGALGALAFIALLATLFLSYLFSKSRKLVKQFLAHKKVVEKNN